MKKINLLKFKPEKPSIFFMHLPKTGGTSVDSAFQKHYGREHVKIEASESYEASKILFDNSQKEFSYDDCFRYRDSLLLYHMHLGSKYISGHIRFNQKIWENTKDKYAYITVLRHPVKRYISNYFFNKYKETEHCRINDELSEFLDSGRAKSWGYMYTKYFSGNPKIAAAPSEELLETAKENALKFNTIGFLEKLDDFVTECKDKYNLHLRIPHKRKNPKSSREISQANLEKINHICRCDVELYDFIRQNS